MPGTGTRLGVSTSVKPCPVKKARVAAVRVARRRRKGSRFARLSGCQLREGGHCGGSCQGLATRRIMAPRTLRSAEDLHAAGLLPEAALAAAGRVGARYSIAVTPAVAGLIDRADPADPIARQYVPDAAELVTAPHESADPTADAPFTPLPGVVHRYPDRALLKPLLACPVYCRFCFRREAVGPDGGVLGEAELEAALGWFEATPAVREAILTGGDPLMLSARRLGRSCGGWRRSRISSCCGSTAGCRSRRRGW